MKSYLYALGLVMLASCSKTEIQETKDTISSANELLRSAKDGFKTVDSLSVLVNDSAEFNRVIAPQIEKHKKTAEQLIKGNVNSLDSINAVLKETAGSLRTGTDLLRTVDSARQEINESSSPFDILSTVSKTLDKLSGQTKAQKTLTPSDESKIEPTLEKSDESSSNTNVKVPNADRTPLSTSGSEAHMKVSVEDLDLISTTLENGIHLYDAKVKSERFGEVQGLASRELTLLIPSQHFDRALDYFSTKLGTLRTKSIETWSFNDSPGTVSILELTLEQSGSYAQQSITGNSKDDLAQSPTSENQSTNAFMQGFSYLKQTFIFLLPFWPLLLLVGVAFYFWRRSKTKAQRAMSNTTNVVQPNPAEVFAETQGEVKNAQALSSKDEASKDASDTGVDSSTSDPYAKYKPKF